MAKRRKKTAVAGYMTFGHHVYLGHASRRVRDNAYAAGLHPVTAKEMRKMIMASMAMQRISFEGQWHDTVKYGAMIHG